MANMFNEDGTYNKTEWKPGDRITASKLNKIEESLEAINNNDISRHVEADARLDALENNKELVDEKLEELEDMAADYKVDVDAAIYEINAHAQRLEKEMNEGIEEIHAVAETVDGKIDKAEADMEAMIAEVEGELNNKANKYFIDVKEFGAKGDGKTDDTAAIQAAFDHVANTLSAHDSGVLVSFSTVFFPKGRYVISAPINIGVRVRIEGERSIIISSAEWCIDYTSGYHGGVIGWHTEISHMIFVGTNGVRLNTRQGDGTAHANLDYGHIYFHDCIFQNTDGYAFVGDVQSCLLKFDMCLFNGPLDVLCDDFVMDTCWSNWHKYHSQEFITFRGSKMYIDKCMFIPYAGNSDIANERAWIGLYDYTIPNGHQGMSFATIDRCNFGGEASGFSAVNNKTKYRETYPQASGVSILNSSLTLGGSRAVRLFEIPNQIVIRNCRGIEAYPCIVDLCKDFDTSKLDDAWNAAGNNVYGGTFNWDCKNNSICIIEPTSEVRSVVGKELSHIYNFIQFRRNYMSGGKFRLINRVNRTSYLKKNFVYADEEGVFWVRIPGNLLPLRHYDVEINNYRFALRSFKMTITTPNMRAGTYTSYSHNIRNYTAVIAMAEQATNQSIRFIESDVFKSNDQNSTIGEITDAYVGIYNNTTTRYPASLIPGDGFGVLTYIDLKLDGVSSTDQLDITIYDLMLDEYEEF